MIFMIIYLFSVLAALGLGVLAGWTDFRGMTIPNYIVVIVFASFFACFGAVHLAGVEVFAPFQSHLIGGTVVLVITFTLFLLKKLGGGDSKLMAAFSFWFGLKGLPVFLFYMLFFGAVLAVAALVLKKKKPVKNPPEGSWIARVQSGESVVPYGIPIAIGAFVGFLYMGLLAPSTLSLFLMPN